MSIRRGIYKVTTVLIATYLMGMLILLSTCICLHYYLFLQLLAMFPILLFIVIFLSAQWLFISEHQVQYEFLEEARKRLEEIYQHQPSDESYQREPLEQVRKQLEEIYQHQHLIDRGTGATPDSAEEVARPV